MAKRYSQSKGGDAKKNGKNTPAADDTKKKKSKGKNPFANLVK